MSSELFRYEVWDADGQPRAVQHSGGDVSHLHTAIDLIALDRHQAIDNVLGGKVDRHVIRNLHEELDERMCLSPCTKRIIDQLYTGASYLCAVDADMQQYMRLHARD